MGARDILGVMVAQLCKFTKIYWIVNTYEWISQYANYTSIKLFSKKQKVYLYNRTLYSSEKFEL